MSAALPTMPRRGRLGGLIRAIAILIGSWAWVPRLLPQITAIDRWIQRRSRGRWSLLRIAGLPGVMLTVPGRKSGVLRSTPLLCVPYGDGVLVAGSNFGGSKPPAWVGNLRAAHNASMSFGGLTVPVDADELEDAERDRAWITMLELWPNYAKYAERTGRVIPVFWLRPAA